MRHVILSLGLALCASSASAACYADYKAKRDDPLRLHYGVVELPDAQCSPSAAADALRSRLGDGWELLQVVGVFDDTGLSERRESAGAYFLRY